MEWPTFMSWVPPSQRVPPPPPPPTVDPALYEAAEAGDVALLLHLIEEGNDLDVPDQYDMYPIQYAVGSPEAVRILLEHGAESHPMSPCESPIWMAAGIGDAESVELLIQYSADIETVETQAGETPLLCAISSGSVDTVKVLVKHGADPFRNGKSAIDSLASMQKAGREPLAREMAAALRQHPREWILQVIEKRLAQIGL